MSEENKSAIVDNSETSEKSFNPMLLETILFLKKLQLLKLLVVKTLKKRRLRKKVQTIGLLKSKKLLKNQDLEMMLQETMLTGERLQHSLDLMEKALKKKYKQP